MSKSAAVRRLAEEKATEEKTCQKCLEVFDFKLNTNSDGERLCDVCHERANMGARQ